MNLPTDLAGRISLRPGGAEPTILSSRPLRVEQLCVGQRPEALPSLMGAVFALCGHAHRLASRLAVRAAQAPTALPDTVITPDDSERLHLQHATARDQMMRMAHDWPRWLPGTAGVPHVDFTADLTGCPLWQRMEDDSDAALQAQLDALPDWLARHWLGRTPQAWLADLAAHPIDGMARWAHTTTGPLASLLRAEHAPCAVLSTVHQPLRLLDAPALQFGALARWLQDRPDAALPPIESSPTSAALVPDTGPWSRHNLSSHEAVDAAPTAWSRLGSRLMDLVQLASPAGRHWLCAGALQPAPGQGIAWVEMARGMLVHWVRLEREGPQTRVRAARVIAPTDLNFHPQGVLAAALKHTRHADDARRLAVAFDPCVEFTIEEPAHA